MATNAGYGVVMPDAGDPISLTGVAEMRLMATTMVAALGGVEDKIKPDADLYRRLRALEQYVAGLSDEAILALVNDGAIDEIVANLVPPGSALNEALLEWFGGASGTALNARDFGAVGDGVTDDTAALQAAVTAAHGKSLFIPAGEYRLLDRLSPRNGSVIYGEKGTVLKPEGEMSVLFWVAGSYASSRDIELATPVDAGDRTLTTKGVHRFESGHTIRLISQRVATSEDAGENQLGWPAGDTEAYFAEFATVLEVPYPNTVVLDHGLVFSGYRGDKTQETHPQARDSTQLRSWNGAGDGCVIRDLEIDGDSRTMIRISRAKNARVRDVRIRRRTSGRGIELQDCYQVKCENVRVECDTLPDDNAASGHASQNIFHTVGSQSSGFYRCEAVQGTQSYDFTYNSNLPYTSLYCYVVDSASYGSLSGAMTSHPGTYGTRITGNNFTECRRTGIAVRANGAVIANNQVSGSLDDNGVSGFAGIYIYENGGKDSLIANNMVRNFQTGMRINDGAGKPFGEWIGCTVKGNVFQNFDQGFVRLRGAAADPIARPQGIIIKGNTFLSDRPDAVGVRTCENGRHVNGVTVTGNDFRLTHSGSAAVEVTANSLNTVVRGNTIHDAGRPLRLTDINRVSGIIANVLWGENTVLKAGTSTLPGNTTGFRIELITAGSGGAIGPHTHSADDISSSVLDPARLPLVFDDSAGEKVTLGGVLVKYESGTRRLDAEILTEEGWTNAEVHLSRSLNTVTINCENLQRDESGSGWTTLVRLPAGFRPTATRRAWGKSFRDRDFQVWTDGRVQVQSPVPDSDYVGTTFVTADAPPTTLPGTPG